MRAGAKAVTFMLFTFSVTIADLAQALDVDWKYYGNAAMSGNGVRCFYDAVGVVETSEGHVRAWTKCLLETDITAIDPQHAFGGKIIHDTAKKFIDHYIPPFALVEDIDSDKAMTIMMYEEIADIGNIQPSSRLFYELNCSQQMARELSMQFLNRSGLAWM